MCPDASIGYSASCCGYTRRGFRHRLRRIRGAKRSGVDLEAADHDPVPPKLLCLVESRVRSAQHGFHTVAVIGEDPDPNRHRDRADEPALVFDAELLNSLSEVLRALQDGIVR